LVFFSIDYRLEFLFEFACLGNTSLEISALGLGTTSLGGMFGSSMDLDGSCKMGKSI